MGGVEVVMTLTAMAGESEGSDVEDQPGGAAAGMGATSDDTSEDADSEGAVVRHGAGKRERGRVAGRQENPVGEYLGLRNAERGPKASRVAENLGEDLQGVGGGFKLPRGT